jgi:hypothetical protein
MHFNIIVGLYLIILITFVFPLPEGLFHFAAIILSSFTKYSNLRYVVFYPNHVNAYVLYTDCLLVCSVSAPTAVAESSRSILQRSVVIPFCDRIFNYKITEF